MIRLLCKTNSSWQYVDVRTKKQLVHLYTPLGKDLVLHRVVYVRSKLCEYVQLTGALRFSINQECRGPSLSVLQGTRM